eukprot:m.316258 g.316258  ORF g.316258 m.316258 type:complete len:63 (-) comp16421_c4_seq1:278-466(-)
MWIVRPLLVLVLNSHWTQLNGFSEECVVKMSFEVVLRDALVVALGAGKPLARVGAAVGGECA